MNEMNDTTKMKVCPACNGKCEIECHCGNEDCLCDANNGVKPCMRCMAEGEVPDMPEPDYSLLNASFSGVLTHVGIVPTIEAICRVSGHKGVLRLVGKTLVCDQCRDEANGDPHYGKHYPKLCDICHRPYVANGFQQRYCTRCTTTGRNRQRRNRQ